MSELPPPKLEVFEIEDEFSVKFKHNLPKPPFRMLICGPSGSGKTQLIMNMLLNKDFYWTGNRPFFNRIFIMSPTVLSDPIWKKLQSNEEIWNRCSITDEFETQTLDMMLNGNDREPKLLIIDDFAAHLRNTDKTVLNVFFRSRHVNCSVVLVTQNYKSVPKPCRSNASDIILFNFSSDKERKLIEEEMGTKQLSGKTFVRFLDEMLKEPYSFIWKNNRGQFHKKFSLVKLIDDVSDEEEETN
jgi:type IV secretory pathway VirB4 component